MASNCFILAHNNIFNKAILKKNAHYYTDSKTVTNIMNNITQLYIADHENFVNANLEEIRNKYSWDKLVDEHEKYFMWLLEQYKNR